MNTSSYLQNGRLFDIYQKATHHLLFEISPELHASAYRGLHEKTFAESEFAGKYLDICAYYGANGKTAEVRERALRNCKIVLKSILENQREDGYIGGVVPEEEW